MNAVGRVVVLSLVSFGLLLAAGAATSLDPPAVAIAAAALSTAALLCVLAVGLASLRPGPTGAAARRLGLAPGVLPAWNVALLCLGTMALSNALDALIQLLGLEGVGTLGEMDEALAGARGGELGFALFAIAIASGAGEELFFRGWLQRGLERWLPRTTGAAPLAILLASVAFGAMHADRVHSPAAFALGLYLGSVAWVSGGTRAAIACHVLNNAAAVADLAFEFRVPGPAGALIAAELAVAGGALVAALRVRRVRSRGDPAPGPPEEPRGSPPRPQRDPSGEGPSENGAIGRPPRP
jgi:membrane protease YdiL (CAAX protease family)